MVATLRLKEEGMEPKGLSLLKLKYIDIDRCIDT